MREIKPEAVKVDPQKTYCCGKGLYSRFLRYRAHGGNLPSKVVARWAACVGCHKRVGEAVILDPIASFEILKIKDGKHSDWIEESELKKVKEIRNLGIEDH